MKDYHYILGVPKTATKAEIKSAYRKLSKKFHPDVNDGDEFFADRFKDIQEAYEFLMGSTGEPRQQPPPKEQSSAAQPEIVLFEVSKAEIELGDEVFVRWFVTDAQNVRINLIGEVPVIGEKKIRPTSVVKQGQLVISAVNSAGEVTRNLSINVHPAKTRKNSSVKWLVALILLCLGGGIWIAYDNHQVNQKMEQDRERRANAARVYQQERERQSRAQYEEAPFLADPKPAQRSKPSGAPSQSSGGYADSYRNSSSSSASSFTIGSTREEVISAQGTPSSVRSLFDTETLSYGLSRVELENGRVKGYSNHANNLRVAERGNTARRTDARFTMGSTRAEVIAAQGTPSSVSSLFNTETLSYGLSRVELENGRVKGYSNHSNNLRIK